MMHRWDDLTPEEQQRYLTAEELRAQLATVTAERDERSLVAEQLSMALHVKHTQLTAVTAERDQLRSQLERYGADQWRRGNAGKEPQEFAEWQRETAADRRAAFNGGEI